MPLYGEKFVYGNKEFSEGEVRVARTRAEFALWGRQQARRYAEAKKRPKQTAGGEREIVTVMNNGPSVQEDEVRRSLCLPKGFMEHLMRQEEFFLHYLRGHYNVSIMVAVPKKRVHIKGPKSRVMTCYECMKELLVRWHQRQDGDQ